MTLHERRPFVLAVGGLAAMLVGCVDPLEGSVLIVVGAALVALAARLGGSRHARAAALALTLAAIGVAAMFALSAVGGVGGASGRPGGWALLVLPYPVGLVLGLVTTVRLLREQHRARLRHS